MTIKFPIQILIKGIQLTSSNPNNQSIDLSMISSNMLASMEVKKTVIADMDASVIGGIVNLEMREAKVKEPVCRNLISFCKEVIMLFLMHITN